MGAMAAARPVRIHLPWTALIMPALLAVCVMPIAGAGGAWSYFYVLPAAVLVLLAFAGTTATGSHLTTRWLRGWTRLAWADVLQLEFPGARWAVAVTQSGRRVVLPGVRPADLPRIVAAAGGRLFLQRRVTQSAEAESAADPAELPVTETAVPGPASEPPVPDRSPRRQEPQSHATEQQASRSTRAGDMTVTETLDAPSRVTDA